MGAGSACASARGLDFVRPRSKNKIYTASKKAVRFEKDTKSLTRDFVLQVDAGSIYAPARRSDFVRPKIKNRKNVPNLRRFRKKRCASGGCREYLYSRSEVGLCLTEK